MKPTLFGYGLTTKAIAHALGGGCTFFDDNVKEPYTDEEGNRLFPSYLFDPQASSLEVTTPSLKPSHPLIQKAKHLLSEYDYFLGNEQLAASSEQPKTEVSQSDTYRNSSLLTPRSSLSKPFTIWISGTNGKTTTTQMLTHLLKNRGAVSGGNIGTPLAALSPDAPIWVLETSSFTLHHTHSASPGIYLLLPITPDHLDWHGTPRQYEADKLKPLLTMKEGELALVPKGLHLPQTKAYVVEYDSNAFLAEYFKIDSTKIRFKAAFLQDALLALAVTKVLFEEIDYECINAFVLDAHRQEEFKDVRGRLWVNDSKATNLDATIQALKGYADKPIHLILGGDDKGVDLSPLFESMRGLDVTLYIIGANQEKLLALAKTYGIKAVNTQTIDKAVEAIDKVHTSKSTALLSPAAASLDQFTSYKHRGEMFMQLVKALVD